MENPVEVPFQHQLQKRVSLQLTLETRYLHTEITKLTVKMSVAVFVSASDICYPNRGIIGAYFMVIVFNHKCHYR